jgi:ADP-ribose pyrophosphatase YjhB (NUDIX family)
MDPHQLLSRAQRLQALSQAGLAYATNPYDRERYEEMHSISVKLLAELTDEPVEKIIRVFASEDGYPTPKIDVRAVLSRTGPEILLVRERIDGGKWTLPGGWADIGYTPFEVAAKEAYEETGLIVQPVRLLALLDKRKHPHPPSRGMCIRHSSRARFRAARSFRTRRRRQARAGSGSMKCHR